jgi:hypothetical protein
MKTLRITAWLLLMISVAAMIAEAASLVVPKSTVHGGGYALSLGPQFHISLTQGSLVFYSDTDYGPYRGSILFVDAPPPGFKARKYGLQWGIYFRDFYWPNGDRLWTLMVSLWYPILLFGFATLLCEYRAAKMRGRRKQYACPCCGYLRQGLQTQTMHCPECGADLYP